MEKLRFYSTIEKFDDATDNVGFMAWGYASTEAVDRDGDIITKAAMLEAWSDYMGEFGGNVREQHGHTAAGIVKEYRFDQKGVYVGVEVVDPVTVTKVRKRVLQGFSIGAVVLKRDSADHRRVTKLRLTELSLVDRGANEEARIEIFKIDGGVEDEMADGTMKLAIDTSAVDAAIAKAAQTEAKVTAADARAVEYLQKAAKLDESIVKLDATLAKLGGIDQAIEKLAKVEAIEKSLGTAGETLDQACATILAMNTRLVAIEGQPAAAVGAVSGVAIEKADDGNTKGTPDPTPKDAVEAIAKAQRAPMRGMTFGAGATAA